MRMIGLFLIAAALVAPLYWFWPLMGKHDQIALMSQYIGCVALIAMGVSQFLALRLRWQQMIFGPLDQIYQLHKWLGIIAITAILLHDTVDADIDGLGAETLLTEFAETLGELSLYGFLVLVVLSIATYVPYHLWRWTHRLMGAFFAASSLHYLFILKPFEVLDPLGLYVGGFCILGILSYLITLLPFSLLGGRHVYRVASVEQTGEAVAVSVEPEKKGMKHRAGQFAFVHFPGRGKNEVHPFTISKAPEGDRTLRFTFKPLGDDTRRLAHEVVPGDVVRVSPAYGRFERRGKKPEVWIAGGIGVTPFIAFAQSLKKTDPPVDFFYSVSDASKAAHLQDFANVAERCPNFRMHLVESSKTGRLNVDLIEARVEAAMSDVTVYYCGSDSMRKDLQAGLVANGLPYRRFKYEVFEIRSGIAVTPVLNGVARLAEFLLMALLRRRAKVNG